MDVSDRRPGKQPRVDSRSDAVTITFVIGSYEQRAIELVLRCERNGAIYVAIPAPHEIESPP
jgi:hypothetical protein